jgi:hypothetical protein
MFTLKVDRILRNRILKFFRNAIPHNNIFKMFIFVCLHPLLVSALIGQICCRHNSFSYFKQLYIPPENGL